MCTTSRRPSASSAVHHAVTADPAVRIGDVERDRTATRLGEAFTNGYLSLAEYETRVGQAFSAQTAGSLGELTRDLPVERIGSVDPHRRAGAWREIRIRVLGYLAMTLLLIGIWLAVGVANGSWYFWPVWPILGAGIGVVGHALPIRFAFACPAHQGSISPARIA